MPSPRALPFSLSPPADINPQPRPLPTDSAETLRWAEANREDLRTLLDRFGLQVLDCEAGARIPGSYWGEPEAGLMGSRVFVRPDTPVHSLLHEACHFVCMDPRRRAELDTDAGGDYAEEDAVCYLQVLLAGEVSGLDPARILADMDAWGYTFRLGSARAWFDQDAADARDWLQGHRIIDEAGRPTWSVRRD